MEYKITGRHLEITPAIHDYAEKKAKKLPKYYDRVQSVTVVVEKQDRLFKVEFLVDLEHMHELVARAEGEDLYAAIDAAEDKMERQLTDHKEKLRNRKHIA